MDLKSLARRTMCIGAAACALIVASSVAPHPASAAKAAAAKAESGPKPYDVYVQTTNALLSAPDADLPALSEKLDAVAKELEASLRRDLAAAEARRHWATAAGLRLQLAALTQEPPAGALRKAAAFAVKRFLAATLAVGSLPSGVSAPPLDWKMQDVDLTLHTLDEAMLWVAEPATLSVSALEAVGVSATTSEKSGTHVVDSGFVANPEVAAKQKELDDANDELLSTLRAMSAAGAKRDALGYKRLEFEERFKRLKADIAKLPPTKRTIETVAFKQETQTWHGTVRRTWSLTLGKQVSTVVAQVDLASYSFLRDGKPGWQSPADMMAIAKAELDNRASSDCKELIRKATLQQLESRASTGADARREADWGRHFAYGPIPEIRDQLALKAPDEVRTARRSGPIKAPAATVSATAPAPVVKPKEWAMLGEPDRSCPADMAWVAGGVWVAGGPLAAAGIPGFCMDRTEVTARQFAGAVAAGKCSADELVCGPNATYGKADKADHPINCVAWPQAATYCAALGKRLPTADEWAWAAGGQTNRYEFPWGDQPPDQQLCWKREKGSQGTCAVGSFPGGDSALGLHDLAGNVWEWTASPPYEGHSEHVYTGGSWFDDYPGLVSTSNTRNSAGDARHEETVGFRCVRKP